MAYASAITIPSHVLPTLDDRLSNAGAVNVIVTAKMRAVKQLAYTSQFWRTVPDILTHEPLPASMMNVSGVTWGRDDEEEYVAVAVVHHEEPSVDDEW